MSRKKTIEEVRGYVESQGYKLLSTEYKGTYSKLELECRDSHKFEVSWTNFKNAGNRCPICAAYRRRKTIEEIREEARKYRYEVLSSEYVPCMKIKYRCPEGHEFEMRSSDFQQGVRCPVCDNEKQREYMLNGGAAHARSFIKNPKKTIEEIREETRKYRYEVLSNEYINNWTKLKLRCPKSHEFEMSWSDFQQDHRCPMCAAERDRERMLNGGAAYMLSFVRNPSKPQVKLFHLIQEVCPYSVLNYPCVALNCSIDIAVPQLSLAIEYDGSYWHQDEESDRKRQQILEEEGWTVLRYRDYIPTKEELLKDINQILGNHNERSVCRN